MWKGGRGREEEQGTSEEARRHLARHRRKAKDEDEARFSAGCPTNSET